MSLPSRFSHSRHADGCHKTASSHRRGDTFARLLTIPTAIPDGFFVGWTPTAQARTQKGQLVAEFVCEWSDPVTTRQLTVKCIDTSAWPLVPLDVDVQFKRDADGVVRSTSTVTFAIVKDITV